MEAVHSTEGVEAEEAESSTVQRRETVKVGCLDQS